MFLAFRLVSCPHEDDTTGDPVPATAKTTIQPVDEKRKFEISWPNVIRIDRTYKAELSIDWTEVKTLGT